MLPLLCYISICWRNKILMSSCLQEHLASQTSSVFLHLTNQHIRAHCKHESQTKSQSTSMWKDSYFPFFLHSVSDRQTTMWKNSQVLPIHVCMEVEMRWPTKQKTVKIIIENCLIFFLLKSRDYYYYYLHFQVGLLHLQLFYADISWYETLVYTYWLYTANSKMPK